MERSNEQDENGHNAEKEPIDGKQMREFLMDERRNLMTRVDNINKMLGIKPKKGRCGRCGSPIEHGGRGNNEQ